MSFFGSNKDQKPASATEAAAPATPPAPPPQITDLEIRLRCIEAAARVIQTVPVVDGNKHPTLAAANNALGLAQAFYDFAKGNVVPTGVGLSK